MSSVSSECVAAEIGDAIALEVVLKMGQGKDPEITLEQEKHLRDCAACRESREVWVAKGRVAFRTTRAYDILNKAAACDQNVLTKEVSGGKAFFERSERDPRSGTFVFASDDGAIFDPEERTLEYFENWRGE